MVCRYWGQAGCLSWDPEHFLVVMALSGSFDMLKGLVAALHHIKDTRRKWIESGLLGVLFRLTFLLYDHLSSLQNFEVKADDLEPIVELGRGAYGVVEKMRHVPSEQIMAVKVELTFRKIFYFFSVCACPSRL